MDRLIKHILIESEENFSENDFFKPKGIEKRIRKRNEEVRVETLKKNEENKVARIRVMAGLNKIRDAYKNKDFKNKHEENFCELCLHII